MISYKFIGHCDEDNHDKVWVMMKLQGQGYYGSYAAVWGRRGKKLQYLIHKDTTEWDMEKLIDGKLKKNYHRINETRLTSVYPDFENDLKGIALWAILSL